MGFADGNGASVVLIGEHVLHKREVKAGVLAGIYGTCCAVDGLIHTVEGHDVARRRHPKRQIGVGEGLEVVDSQDLLVRYLNLRTVSGIVHDERSLLLLRLYKLRNFRI